MNDQITAIFARQVLDSRGQPTVEVEVRCSGAMGRAIVPSGASTGKYEALELRDGDPADYAGKSVCQAVAHVRQILAPAILGVPASDQEAIDRKLCELDGTPDKSRLGANAILGLSLACARAAAASRNQPLWRYLDPAGRSCMPLPMVNLISGGLHAGRNLDMQDFLFLPIAANSYSEALHMTVRVYRALSVTLQEHGHEGILVGDASLDPLSEPLRIGGKQIVANELHAPAKRFSQQLPPGPIVLGHAVLDAKNWIAVGPVG